MSLLRVKVFTVLVVIVVCFLVGLNEQRRVKGVEFARRFGNAQNSPPTLTSPPDETETAITKKRWVETVSWEPRIFIYHNFLSEEECQDIINLAIPDLSRSLVVGDTGSDESNVRTSNGVFADYKHMSASPLLRNIEKRIAEWTKLPIENGESFYIIRYEGGQKYEPHMDYFSNDDIGKRHMERGGNRMATVLTYLHAPEEGGETTFPRIDLKVTVKAGDAVLFWDMDPSNTVDPMTLHGSIPVLKGVKWAMPKWIREKPTYRWDERLPTEEKEILLKEEQDWIKKKLGKEEEEQQGGEFLEDNMK